MKKLFSLKTWMSLFVVSSIMLSFVIPAGAVTNDAYMSEYQFFFEGSQYEEPHYRATDHTKTVSYTGNQPYFTVIHWGGNLRYAMYLYAGLTEYYNPFVDTRVTYRMLSDKTDDNHYYYMTYLNDGEDSGFGVGGEQYYMAAIPEDVDNYGMIIHTGYWNL